MCPRGCQPRRKTAKKQGQTETGSNRNRVRLALLYYEFLETQLCKPDPRLRDPRFRLDPENHAAYVNLDVGKKGLRTKQPVLNPVYLLPESWL